MRKIVLKQSWISRDDSILNNNNESRLIKGKLGFSAKCLHAYHSCVRTIIKIIRRTATVTRLRKSSSDADILSQAEEYIKEYIYSRLIKLDISTRGIISTPFEKKSSRISGEIQLYGNELERIYSYLYKDVSKQLSIVFQLLYIKKVCGIVADNLFKDSVTWGKIISLFSFSGALAVDCCIAGHPELIQIIVKSFTCSIKTYAASWIAEQGGWEDIIEAFRITKRIHLVWCFIAIILSINSLLLLYIFAL